MGLLALLLLSAQLQVKVDGDAIDPQDLVQLPGGGAVARVEGIPLWLDGPGPWTLEVSSVDGEPALVRQQGRVVGVRVWKTTENGKDVLHDPLSKLPPDQLAGLRGVAVAAWSDGVAAALARIPAARLCLAVDHAAHAKAALPPLPQVPCLVVDASSQRELLDLSALKQQRALRFLEVAALGQGLEFDARWLVGAPVLEVLRLSGPALRNPDALAALPALRRLTLEMVDDAFALTGTFPRLERLEVAHARLVRLQDLVAPSLRELELRGAPLETLPASLPALTSLVALGTRLSPDTVAAFKKQHPRAAVDSTWAEALRRRLAGATQLQVRSGGLCHRDPDQERVLVTLLDPKDLVFVLTTFAFDEPASRGMCMCCGGPTLTFLRGTEVLEEVSFQHGAALRWRGWPADATLADERLVHFLAERGVKGPQDELEEEREQEAASRAAFERYQQLLPPAVMELARAGASPADTVGALLEGGLDAARVAQVLRLYAASGGPFNLSFGLDDALAEQVVAKLTTQQLVKAATGADSSLTRGVSRAVFQHRKVDALKDPAFAKLLPAVARAALQSPFRHDRVRALQVLGRVETRAATQVLRDVLSGALAPVAGEEPPTPGGNLSFEPADGEVDGSVSEKVLAGYLLVKRKDAQSLPRVRALAAEAAGEDAKLLGKLGLTR